MPPALRIESGSLAGTEVPIASGEPLRVGRTKQASVVLGDDELLSRVHFELQLRGSEVWLRDLESSNGTCLNGVAVKESVLREGDEILAGATRFSLRLQAGDASTPAAELLDLAAIQDCLLLRIRRNLQPLYAVVDAAHEPAVLRVLLESKSEHVSLFESEAAPRLVQFAPYLVRLALESPLLEALVRTGWGRSWGIYFATSAPPQVLIAFLRQLLKARMPDGEEALLRFYDPRILRALLPSATPQQQRQIFGPIRFFLVESEDPAVALGFSLSARGLETVELPLVGDLPPKLSLAPHPSSASLYPARAADRELRPTLHLGPEQVDRLAAQEQDAFAKTVVAELRDGHPERFASATEESLEALVQVGRKRSERYGLRVHGEMRRYIELMVQLGENFDTDPELPWASNLLHRRLPPAVKLERLESAAKDQPLSAGR